jgi:hypothetical protein
MAKNKSGFPGKTPFAQVMNCVGAFIFERGLRGDLDCSISTTRIGTALTLTIYSSDGVTHVTFTEEEHHKRAAPPRADSADRSRGRS